MDDNKKLNLPYGWAFLFVPSRPPLKGEATNSQSRLFEKILIEHLSLNYSIPLKV